MNNPFPNYQDIAAKLLVDNTWKEVAPTANDSRSFTKNGYLAVLNADTTVVYNSPEKGADLLINIRHPQIMRNPFYSFIVSTNVGLDQKGGKNVDNQPKD